VQCRWISGLLAVVCVCAVSGCWAPLCSPGVPAHLLPECYRTPTRGVGPPLNFSSLTLDPPVDYLLGANDTLDVTVPQLFEGAETQPLRVRVMASGEIQLPLIGPVKVEGMNLLEAQQAITEAYADGFLNDPSVNIALAEKATIDILVLGEVANPGVQSLAKYQNDVGHALASAGGLTDDAGDTIEVHRRLKNGRQPSLTLGLSPRQVFGFGLCEEVEILENSLAAADSDDPKEIMEIPLRGLPPGSLSEQDVQLGPGDVIVVPNRKQDVFFVVGQLNRTNLVRFTLGDRERELGTGLILPRDRDIDVVTAVAMAGYIDPIDSPTTVTVQRTGPDKQPMLIRVDLIKARYNRCATVLVQAGDIIYINPDFPWWFRRTFDRIVPDLILLPYAKAVGP